MNFTITNLGPISVPFSSPEDKGFVSLLEPGVPFTMNSEAITVANVGDNPSALEELTEGLQNFVEKLGQLLTFWRERSETMGVTTAAVHVSIENRGPNALRVLLGINTNEVQVAAGDSCQVEAPGYIEIRELGV